MELSTLLAASRRRVFTTRPSSIADLLLVLLGLLDDPFRHIDRRTEPQAQRQRVTWPGIDLHTLFVADQADLGIERILPEIIDQDAIYGHPEALQHILHQIVR